MAEKYYDICDVPYKRNSDTRELKILKVSSDGEVLETVPTQEESEKFSRNWSDSPVICKDTAYKLAKNPGLSY